VKPISFQTHIYEMQYHQKVWKEKWKLPAIFLFYDEQGFTNSESVFEMLQP
jgi:hypothetical protein